MGATELLIERILGLEEVSKNVREELLMLLGKADAEARMEGKSQGMLEAVKCIRENMMKVS